jgi:hypothetical protein
MAQFKAAHATPESWFEPAQTVTGNAASGFGSALACSQAVPGVNYSYIAVGAPKENADEGRAYIVGPAGVIQTIAPPALGGTGNFGSALAFLNDINGDSIQELAVGEPDADGVNGKIHIYTSTGNQAVPYSHCASQIDVASFGSFILQTTAAVIGGVQIIVSTPSAAAVKALNVTYAMAVCTISPVADYQSSGPVGSRYGQALGEISTGMLATDLIVGAPQAASGAGRLYSLSLDGTATSKFTGIATDRYAVAVASRPDTIVFGFNAPQGFDGNTAYLKTRSGGTFGDLCALSIPMSDLADTSAQSMAHLDDLFRSLFSFGAAGTAFGVYRTESETGGAVALLGVDSGVCLATKQINNCVLDIGQKQGQALGGGPECVTTNGVKVLLVGAPGYSNNTGRIDLYAEGTERGSALPCTVVDTPTPTLTPTAAPIETPRATPIPVVPRTSGLPVPEARVKNRQVVVRAPKLVSANRRYTLSGYQFTVTRMAGASAITSFSIDQAKFSALGSTSAKKREIFSRRNQITLRNLGAGAYVVSYRAVFTNKSGNTSQRILGRASKTATFRIP